jgi:uncharacterized protein (DUF1697 family)
VGTDSFTFAALLRGINVGGRNRLPMGALRASLAENGFEDVVTYVQSGNVVFRTRESDPRKVAAHVERQIAESFGLEVSVLVRTHEELAGIAHANPFLADESDPKRLHVVFLDGEPRADALASLDPDRSPPDRFAARGREIYLHLPNGAGRTKLTLDYFERRLGVRGTGRNWNTLLELISLTRPDGAQ